jgi:VWFA-related protein
VSLRASLCAVLAASCLLVAPHAVAAGQAPDEKRSPPVFRGEAVLVAVPVFVTDGSGKAVPGLTAQDFEVLDGGKPVAVVAFQAIDVAAEDALAAGGEMPVAIQAAAPRQFVLLFDLVFSPRGSLTRVRQAASHFVRSLGPRDLVAVATYGRSGLKVLTSFTLDRAYVARIVDTLGLAPEALTPTDPLGLSGGESNANAAGFDVEAELQEEQELINRTILQSYRRNVLDFLDGLESLAEALAPLRGRKQVVLISGGYAERAWTGTDFGATPEQAFNQGREDPTALATLDRFRSDVFRASGLSDVVIHSIDVKGIEGPVDVGSPTGRLAREGGATAMRALSDNTGGRFVQQTNDFSRAFDEVDAVSRHYYVLAFEPVEPASKKDKPRDLKVRVRRDGLRVSHRPQYVVPAAAPDPKAVQLMAAEAIAKGLTGGRVGLDVVALPYRDRDGKAAIPAVLRIDGDALEAAGRSARGEPLTIHVYGYAMADGRVVDTLEMETKLDTARAGPQLRRDGFRVLTTFAAAPGPVELRFFVRAGKAGETGALRSSVTVPAFGEQALVVSRPLPTTSATGKVVGWFETRAKPPLEIPFRVASSPFLPDPDPTLRPGQSRELCVFTYPAAAGQNAQLQVAGELLPAGKPALPLRVQGLRAVADPDGFDRYLVTVVPPAAPAGRYTLRLSFTDAATGRTSRGDTEVELLE